MKDNDNLDWLWLIIAAVFFFPAAAFFGGARQWMLNTHIVVPADQAVLAIHDWDIGLDWPRLLIAFFALALASTLATAALRYRRGRTKKQ